MKKRRNWKELNPDCLAKIFEKLDLESLLMDVPFVCKSWYRASLNPQCWKIVHFIDGLSDSPVEWCYYCDPFVERFMDEYRLEKFTVTGFIKFVIGRSRRSALRILLPSTCTTEALEFISNECPALQVLGIPHDLLQTHGEPIPELVRKFKDLQQLHLGSTGIFFEKILTQISLNCKNFNGLSLRGNLSNKEASAIATILPKIKYLWLRINLITHESLQIILKACKDLVFVDALGCAFEAEDEEILNMGSHIKTFLVDKYASYDSVDDGLFYISLCNGDEFDYV